jgi:hypothetical protein
MFLRFFSAKQATQVRLGSQTEFLGQSECRSCRTPLHDPETMGMRLHPTGSIRQNVQDLIERVLPHFHAYPLASSKQHDVERFAKICRIIHEARHLEEEGLSEIVEIAMAMNPSGKRKYQASDILKSLGSGERIVYAAGNCGSP